MCPLKYAVRQYEFCLDKVVPPIWWQGEECATGTVLLRKPSATNSPPKAFGRGQTGRVHHHMTQTLVLMHRLLPEDMVVSLLNYLFAEDIGIKCFARVETVRPPAMPERHIL